MHDIRTRARQLYRRLTGAAKFPTARYSYPPRYLWGDLGLPQDAPRGRPRVVPAHLLRT